VIASADFVMERAKSLGELAREVLDDEGGLTAPAIARLQAMIAEDEALRLSIAASAIAEYAACRMASMMMNDRAAVWNAAERRVAGLPTRAKTSVAALGKGIRESLLNFPMAGGLRLRDANRAAVSAQAQMYATHGADMMHKARWLATIAARLPDDDATVGEVLTDGEVETLQAETANV
jgi:predicted NBD/HSP70 family sugar kinase